MATLGTMKTRIADEIARSDLTSQIAAAILSAIEFYDRRRFWFNETEATFNTVAGTDAYTSATATFLSTLIEDDSMTVTVSDSKEPMHKISFAEMQRYRIDNVQSGAPTHYAYYRQRLYLHPVPDAAYPIIVFHTGTLGIPASDGASNAWTTEAEELIRLRAKADLFENVIREFGEADRLRAREQEALQSLIRFTNGRTATGFVVAEYL
jgi:hypothetical protein